MRYNVLIDCAGVFIHYEALRVPTNRFHVRGVHLTMRHIRSLGAATSTYLRADVAFQLGSYKSIKSSWYEYGIKETT